MKSKLKCVDLRSTGVDAATGSDVVLKDKNGNVYSVASFVSLGEEDDADMVYGARNINKRLIFAHDGFSGLAAGKKVYGDIVRFATSAPYEIRNADGSSRLANHITVVVFENENAVNVANNQLRDSGVTVVTAEGEITKRVVKAQPAVAAGAGVTEPVAETPDAEPAA